MDTPSIGRPSERYPDADPYGPAPLAPPTAAERAERDAAYARMDGFISSGSPDPHGPDPHCEDAWHPQHDFDSCGSQVVPGAALFVRQATDVNAVDPRDVKQGAMRDCYCLAALGAIASSPEGRAMLQNAITENKNDRGDVVSYTVTLHKPEKSWWPWSATTFEDVRITLDATYAVGHADPRSSSTLHEVWPLVMERAYAQYSGGYNAIAHGGRPSAAMQAFTGRPATRIELSDGYGVTELRRDLAAGKLVVLGTKKGPPLGRGLAVSHSYVVTGTEERDGKLWVQLRNPWGIGETEPVPADELGQWFHAVDVGSVR